MVEHDLIHLLMPRDHHVLQTHTVGLLLSDPRTKPQSTPTPPPLCAYICCGTLQLLIGLLVSWKTREEEEGAFILGFVTKKASWLTLHFEPAISIVNVEDWLQKMGLQACIIKNGQQNNPKFLPKKLWCVPVENKVSLYLQPHTWHEHNFEPYCVIQRNVKQVARMLWWSSSGFTLPARKWVWELMPLFRGHPASSGELESEPFLYLMQTLSCFPIVNRLWEYRGSLFSIYVLGLVGGYKKLICRV